MKENGYNKLHEVRHMIPTELLEALGSWDDDALASQIAHMEAHPEPRGVNADIWRAMIYLERAERTEELGEIKRRVGHIHEPNNSHPTRQVTRAECKHCGKDIRLNIGGTGWIVDWAANETA